MWSLNFKSLVEEFCNDEICQMKTAVFVKHFVEKLQVYIEVLPCTNITNNVRLEISISKNNNS